MKKIDKLIFSTITLAWIFPTIFFHESFNRLYVYNALTNSVTWIFSIDENFKYLPIDNIIFNITNLITVVLFVFYFVRFVIKKQSTKILLILECCCLLVFGYRFYNVMRFTSYGEFYPPYAVILETIAIVFYFMSLSLTIYKLIKYCPRRPTKAERLQAQIDELQKQIDELKSKDED